MPTDLKTLLYKPIVPISLLVLLVLLLITQIYFDSWAITTMDDVTIIQDSKTIKVKPAYDPEHLKNISVFGEYIPDELGVDDIKKSITNLKLVGIMYSEQEEYSIAMIEIESGQEKMFHVGDKLSGGVIIRKITPYGVVVSRNGSLEKLSLPKEELEFSPPPQPLTLE